MFSVYRFSPLFVYFRAYCERRRCESYASHVSLHREVCNDIWDTLLCCICPAIRTNTLDIFVSLSYPFYYSSRSSEFVVSAAGKAWDLNESRRRTSREILSLSCLSRGTSSPLLPRRLFERHAFLGGVYLQLYRRRDRYVYLSSHVSLRPATDSDISDRTLYDTCPTIQTSTWDTFFFSTSAIVVWRCCSS